MCLADMFEANLCCLFFDSMKCSHHFAYTHHFVSTTDYKFHINGGTTRQDIPIQHFYVMTTDGNLSGAVGKPIIEYYNGGEDIGKGYSDYMNLKLVTVPEDYEADTYKSVGDITTHGNANVTDTNIYEHSSCTQ